MSSVDILKTSPAFDYQLSRGLLVSTIDAIYVAFAVEYVFGCRYTEIARSVWPACSLDVGVGRRPVSNAATLPITLGGCKSHVAVLPFWMIRLCDTNRDMYTTNPLVEVLMLQRHVVLISGPHGIGLLYDPNPAASGRPGM